VDIHTKIYCVFKNVTTMSCCKFDSHESFLVIFGFQGAPDYGRPAYSRCRHYIFALWFLSSFYLFFRRLISAVADWVSAILPHMVWPYSANLGCRYKPCYKRLSGNTGRKKSPKIRHLGTIAQLRRATSSQLRHVSTIGKKLLNSNISPHVLTIR